MIESLLTYKLAAVYILSREVQKHLPRFTIKRDLVQLAGEVCRAVKCRVLVLEEAHCHSFIPQHCKFMLFNNKYSRILIFQWHQWGLSVPRQDLYCFVLQLAENGISLPKHVAVWYLSWIVFYYLYSIVFVEWICWLNYWFNNMLVMNNTELIYFYCKCFIVK
jgi:hypothetical protein